MRGAQHHRNRSLTAEHRPRLGCLIDQHVHRQGGEIHEHDFHHGPHSGQRGPHGHAGDCRLGNRGIIHPRGAEPVQQIAGGLERAARRANILADQENRRIGFHRIVQGLVDGLDKTCFGHLSDLGSGIDISKNIFAAGERSLQRGLRCGLDLGFDRTGDFRQ